MFDTFVALRIVVFALVNHFLDDERWLNGQTASAVYQIVSMQELEGIVKALLTHVGQFLGLGRDQNAPDAHHVLKRHFNAGVYDINLSRKKHIY